MTNEEAIELIKVAQAEVEWSCPMDYAAAFDIAIKALEQKPCEDAISREDALMALTGEWSESRDELIPKAIKRIKKLSPVTPARSKGEWEYVQYDRPSIGNYHCSLCRCIGEPTDFCPNCGAEMEESEVQDADSD